MKLLDFGIAKRIDGATARTDPSVIVGTLEYLAPEQIRGVDIDGRADLYSLGMTLHRALTGEPVFKGDNVAAFIHQHLSVTPTSLRERPGGKAIPPALDAVVLRLLAKEPAGRPATARDAKRLLLASLSAPDAATVSVTRPEAIASAARGTERELDFDLDDAPHERDDLELDLGTSAPRVPAGAPRGPAIVPVAVPVPMPPPQPPPPGAMVAPLPAWLEPLARVPENASKRVAAYALFALVIYVLFFSGSLVPSLVLLLIAALGGASFWARRRGSPPA